MSSMKNINNVFGTKITPRKNKLVIVWLNCDKTVLTKTVKICEQDSINMTKLPPPPFLHPLNRRYQNLKELKRVIFSTAYESRQRHTFINSVENTSIL